MKWLIQIDKLYSLYYPASSSIIVLEVDFVNKISSVIQSVILCFGLIYKEIALQKLNFSIIYIQLYILPYSLTPMKFDIREILLLYSVQLSHGSHLSQQNITVNQDIFTRVFYFANLAHFSIIK